MILYTDGMMQTNGLFSRGYLDMTEGQNAACIVISVRHFLRKLQIQRVEMLCAIELRLWDVCRQGIATLTVQVGLVQLIVGTLEEKGTLLLGSVVYCLYNVAFARLLRPITNIAIMGALSSHHIHLRKLSRVSSLFSLRSGSGSLSSSLYSLRSGSRSCSLAPFSPY